MNELERWVAEQEMAEPISVCGECWNNIATDGDLCKECQRAHMGHMTRRYRQRRRRRRLGRGPRFWALAMLAAYLLLLLAMR